MEKVVSIEFLEAIRIVSCRDRKLKIKEVGESGCMETENILCGLLKCTNKLRSRLRTG